MATTMTRSASSGGVRITRHTSSSAATATATASSSNNRQYSEQPPSSAAGSTATGTAAGVAATTTTTTTTTNDAPKLKNDRGKLTELHGEPPVNIKRNENGHLVRGRMLGEGGFARVYAAIDSLNGATKAVKVISKEQLKSSKTKAKLFAEIKLHQVMDHPNIIKFECCFEDSENVYMQLELCEHNSMLDLLRRRKRFTEPETRYYLTQLIGASQYMHSACVIHRDLKLGNLMLDSDMNLKVGDFGLAALVKFPGERKKTICGTPNYIAPEILFDQNTGHSFEADIWSIGVIVYTMIIGKPPFQTKDVKAIYKKIKGLDYNFPSNVDISDLAMDLVEAILDREPQNRPSASDILNHPFQFDGAFPSSIPASAMDVAPDFSRLTPRMSKDNYTRVRMRSGASLTVSSESTSTPVIPEDGEAEDGEFLEMRPHHSLKRASSGADAVQSIPEPPAQVVAMSSGTTVVAQEIAIEKEVKKVLDPGSPISELLKSARKPLMVSPRALAAQREREKNELARRAVTSASASSSAKEGLFHQYREAEKENAQQQRSRPASARSQDVPKSKASSDEGETGLENAVRALRVTNGTVTSPNRARPTSSSTGGRDKRKAPATASSSFVVASEPGEKLVLTSTEAMEQCWRTLEDTIGSTPRPIRLEEPEYVASPKVFVTAWIDYTHKYGTAYQLTDGSAGVYFNDSTTMIMAPGRQRFDYLSGRKGATYNRKNFDIQSFPEDLDRKVYLMTYFEDYMTKTLERDVEWVFSDASRSRNMDFLVKYYRMKNAIVFKLSNDVLQFNFFDHTKILLTEGATVVTFIGPDYKLKSYPLAKLLRRGERIGLLNGDGKVFSSSDPAKQKTIDGLVFLFGKLEYCREVLKGLCDKRRPATTASAGSA